MSPNNIIELTEEDGVLLTLSPSGGISAKGSQSAIDRWLPTIRQCKAAIISKLQIEIRHAWVLATLCENPDVRYAIDVIDPNADPVIIAVGIRGVATFDIRLPQARYDPFALLKLIASDPMSSMTKNSVTRNTELLGRTVIAEPRIHSQSDRSH